MSDKKIKTFQENIKYTFTKYAIIPVFLITLAFLILFLGIWNYTVYKSNKNFSEEIRMYMNNTVHSYSLLIKDLSKDRYLFTDDIHNDKVVELNRKIYSTNSETGYDGSLYLYDSNLVNILNNKNKDLKDSESDINWGIFSSIKNKPEEISINLSNDNKNYLCIGKASLDNDEIIGYVVIKINIKDFQRILSSTSSQFIITDNNGWIYLADNYIFQDQLGRISSDVINKNGYSLLNNRIYYISSKPILNNSLYLYSFTDYAIEYTMFLVIFLLVVLIFIAITITIRITSGKVTENTTREIDEIASAFGQARKGNLDCHLNVDSSLELKQIGDSYNSMVDGLKKYIRENKELTELAAYSQVKQLEAQFNPHFIFNTLDNIRFMGKINPDISDKMIVALSKLLRYSIKDTSEEVSVKEDMLNTENYLTILKFRFNDRFSYKISVEEEIKECKIPKLMLQALIENAVKYGYGDNDSLDIEVVGYQSGEDIVFKCKDNGVGIKAELLEKIRENLLEDKNRTDHHGLYNINKRIQLMYHDDYGIKLESTLGEGTIVILTLPKIDS